MNFLEKLFNPQGAASQPQPQQPFALPEDELAQMLGGASGGLPPELLAQMQQPSSAPAIQGMPANYMQESQPQQQAPAEEPAEEPRKRRSFLDSLGQLADAVATVGGSQAMYQPTLDGREDRAMAMQDRERLMSQQDLQSQRYKQQLEAGQGELDDTERGRLAQALGAVAASPNAAAMWPQIAQEAGIDPARAEQIGAIIAANPQAAGIFAQSLGYSPNASRNGSQPKEVQLFQLIRAEQGPKAAQAYLQSLTNPAGMTEYQRAQLSISMRRLGIAETAAETKAAAATDAAADLTPGEKKLDQEFAKTYNDYVARGGFADVQKGIQQLQEVRQTLQDSEGITGGISGYLPTPVRSLFNENSVSAQEAVEEVVQRNLRMILGAQFTQKEGERLIERAYNPRLGPAENAKRLDRLITQLTTSAQATEQSARYFEENGTLAGSQGNQKRPAAAAPRPAARSRGAAPAPAARRSVSPAAAEARRRGLIK